jgi:uncharacterized protein
MRIDWIALWQIVSEQFPLGYGSTHGPIHWRRVERNALLLASRNAASETVVRLFALFHDSRRENEGTDPEHGPRGAALATQMHGEYFKLDDASFDLLIHACTWHTEEPQNDDPTIGACYDADRLDLNRVGVTPSADYMSTELGREIARAGSIQPFLPRRNHISQWVAGRQMPPGEKNQLVNAWIEMQRSEHGGSQYNELFWSFEQMCNLTQNDPEIAFEIILEILKKDGSPIIECNLSAGPLEDLLAKHGPAVIVRIEQEAATNPAFSHLLGGVWKNAMTEEVWNRVQACWDRRGWDGIPE